MANAEQHFILPRATFDSSVKILIVRAPYYKDISDDLLAGATTEIESVGGSWELEDVPGALEIPTAIGIAERLSNFDGYVALGCVIRGETTHYETVCNDSSRAIQLLGLQGLCIGNGILTVENRKQAESRANVDDQNKGSGAAAAALHLIALSRKWNRQAKNVGFLHDAEEAPVVAAVKDTPNA
ncbi:6,7-dimethyl-8-ribityllumazine synthase [Pseudopelagicola sp. nBUS_19]|uniref:6,7-dimethyl-8-ribityllumazine synthase n=1 Tax=Pseudopelagicola sp. nBUS_19 TaxID=3395316 RepID=UPI003EBB5C7A